MTKALQIPAILFVIAASILLFTSISFAQETQTQPPTDPCATVICSPSKATCPDGFVSSCSNSCSAGTCSQCTPSCEGHSQTQTTTTTTTTTVPECPASRTCPNGATVSCSLVNNVCACKECPSTTTTTTTTTAVCPAPPEKPPCASDAYPKEQRDANNCITGYQCTTYTQPTTTTTTTCPLLSIPICASDEYLRSKYDESNKCVIGHECVSSSTTTTTTVCPTNYAPVCGKDGKTYSNDCEARKTGTGIAYYGSCGIKTDTCGNYKCEQGEDTTCPNDCVQARQCATSITCLDGSTVACRQTDYGCACDQCPIPTTQIPQGCHQEKDEAGFIRVICESQQCPQPPREVFDKCRNSGGNPLVKKDFRGCEFVDCTFQDTVHVNPIVGSLKCPSGEEVEKGLQGCPGIGLHGVVVFEGGCKVAKCIQKEEQRCQYLPESARLDVERHCTEQGFKIYQRLNEKGCMIYDCMQPGQTCQKDAPQELFKKCGERGGEVVIRRDYNGCIAFADCITRGDERDAFVERPEKVPETTELLSLAFKMESLAIEMDKLSRNAKDIANYYKSTNSEDEGRYTRVASMFESAKDKVNEIKANLREHLNSLTVDDIADIRHDIKYIKDVMLKDILYVMLSSDKESGGIISKSDIEDCGSDGECFDRAFRICKPIKFKPEANAPVIEVKGLENDVCVVIATMPKDQLPPVLPPGIKTPIEMTCKFKDYAFGVQGPEDFIPNCEGSLKELMTKFGGAASAGGHDFPPPEGGPGGCKTVQECSKYCLENYDVCVTWAKEHPAYGPPPTREELKQYSQGEYQFSGPPGIPGKCSGDECRTYCSSSAEAAKECLKVFYDYLPPEARAGLQRIASGESGQGGYQQPYQQYPQPTYTQTVYKQSTETTTKPAESCIGCFDNNICDQGECSTCRDCSKG